jgi:hypothetical protein
MAPSFGGGSYRLAAADGSVFDGSGASSVIPPPGGTEANPGTQLPEIPVVLVLPVIVLIVIGVSEAIRRRRSGRAQTA